MPSVKDFLAFLVGSHESSEVVGLFRTFWAAASVENEKENCKHVQFACNINCIHYFISVLLPKLKQACLLIPFANIILAVSFKPKGIDK